MKTYSISNILVLIFWIFLIFLFLNELFGKQNETFKNTNKTVENTNKIKVYNFNTTWCGHSKNFQPIWDKFAKSIDTTDNITIIDAKCDTNTNDNLVKKYNIEGYPTVIIDAGDKFTTYSGERSVNGLRKALNLSPIMEIKFGNNAPVNKDKIKIFNFNTSWCGHSVRFQPIWDQFTQQVVDANVEVIDVKCDNDENAELCKKYDVPGYPSVLKVKPSGEVINYDGPRTVEGLLDFIKN